MLLDSLFGKFKSFDHVYFFVLFGYHKAYEKRYSHIDRDGDKIRPYAYDRSQFVFGSEFCNKKIKNP